jgi:uncharacterized protein (TIGR00297 family)
VNPAQWQAAAWVDLGLALTTYFLGLLSPSGCVAAFFIGGLVWGCLGWRGWAVLLAFFLIGTAATKFRYKDKASLGVAQDHNGQRRWKHAWANAGAGVLCAVWSLWYVARGDALHAGAMHWAFVACFASALSDTLSSEFGQLTGKPPRLITTRQVVPVGTDGGITLAGTLAGVVGAAALSLLGRFVGLTPVRATLPILLAGLSGNVLDSYLGATLQKRGWMSNETVNFANTCGGAALGYLGYFVMDWMHLKALEQGLPRLVERFI